MFNTIEIIWKSEAREIAGSLQGEAYALEYFKIETPEGEGFLVEVGEKEPAEFFATFEDLEAYAREVLGFEF